jgi:hypothetical protein
MLNVTDRIQEAKWRQTDKNEEVNNHLLVWRRKKKNTASFQIILQN